jgi:hypothetical protein
LEQAVGTIPKLQDNSVSPACPVPVRFGLSLPAPSTLTINQAVIHFSLKIIQGQESL